MARNRSSYRRTTLTSRRRVTSNMTHGVSLGQLARMLGMTASGALLRETWMKLMNMAEIVPQTANNAHFNRIVNEMYHLGEYPMTEKELVLTVMMKSSPAWFHWVEIS